MIINHLIVGANDVPKSVEFYCKFLDFQKTPDDPGSQGGQVLENDKSELLIIPFPENRLPNPAHFAFEVNNIIKFDLLLQRAEAMGLSPRSMPPRDSEKGPTEFSRGDTRYKIFYIFDPSGVNVEVMVNLEAKSSITTTSETPSMFDPITIDAEHVKIRPITAVSWQKLAEGLLYEGSFHATNWGIKTSDDVKKMYENGIAAWNKKRGNPIVFLNIDETEVVGMTNFMNVEPANKMIEIGGTWINKKWQRSHVNTETKFALLQYIFETLKLNRVEFRIDSENLASQKAVQRLGFHFDGMMPRRKVNANGDVRDYAFYSVTDKTWTGIKDHILQMKKKSESEVFKEVQKIKFLRKSGDSAGAFESVLNAIKSYPQSADLNYLAASICDAERTEAEAVPFYLKALELGLNGQDRRDALLGLASTYRSLGEYEKSKNTFNLGIQEFPEYRPFYVFLALTQFNLNSSAESIRLLLEQLIETSSDQEIKSYERALKFYSTRLNEVFE
jgi:RimJ/RimL family protein N-acetyltransferase/catechol 2,3-dioxygenase-like lactoylglutathione lyase family enzyme